MYRLVAVLAEKHDRDTSPAGWQQHRRARSSLPQGGSFSQPQHHLLGTV